MDRIITIIMNTDGSVSIEEEGKEKLKIPSNNRKISAKDIYNSLCYLKGDIYTVEKENKANKDPSVLDCFVDLYKEIVDEINDLAIIKDDDT